MGSARGASPSSTQALLLGSLQGPTEVLPVSSSGHLTAIPWLLGWRYRDLEAEPRKSFEVALHAGSTAAWLLTPSAGTGLPVIAATLKDPRQVYLLALATAPAAAAGLLFERAVEERLSTPRGVAIGLVLGSVAMVLADRAPRARGMADAGPRDALWLGVCQASALIPGVSRSAATLSVARLRGFSPRASWQLSARMATPVIAGATALKLGQTLFRGSGALPARSVALGFGASLASTLAFTRKLRPLEHAWPLWPFALYRCALALVLATRRP